MEIIINNGSIADKRTLDNANADNAMLKANLDYVAMMASIDIPTETEDDTDVEKLQ